MSVLLSPNAPKPLPLPRSARAVAVEVRRLADNGELALPLPGTGTSRRWAALATLGRARRDGRALGGLADLLAALGD
ncbi:MAG TPA: hypothetical protein VGP26_22085 [Actinophytocola sp.]|jgi:hypothetical protein|nr:hypothetical protein [Actinophytocola sp.]